MGSTARHRPGLVGIIPTSTPSSLSSLPSDVTLESCLVPSPPTLSSPLLGLPSANTLLEGVELVSQEQVTTELRGSEAADIFWDSPPEVVSVTPTSVTEWLRQSQLPPEVVPQSPPESVLSNTPSLYSELVN